MGDKSPKSKQKADKQKKQQHVAPAVVPEPQIAGKVDKSKAVK